MSVTSCVEEQNLFKTLRSWQQKNAKTWRQTASHWRHIASLTNTQTHISVMRTHLGRHKTTKRGTNTNTDKRKTKRLTWAVWWKGVGALLWAWRCLEKHRLLPRPTCHLSAGRSFPVTPQCWCNPTTHTEAHTHTHTHTHTQFSDCLGRQWSEQWGIPAKQQQQ